MPDELQENPYAAPSSSPFRSSLDADATDRSATLNVVSSLIGMFRRPLTLRGLSRMRPQSAWLLMMLSNLPIPLFFGLMMTDGTEPFGILPGTAAICFCGIGCCRIAPRFMMRVTLGSALMAMSQLFPVVQAIAGTTAMKISQAVFPVSEMDPGNDVNGMFQVTFMTITTGIGLILPSFVLGILLVSICGLERRDGQQ